MYKFEMSFAPRANLGQVPGEDLIGNVYMLMLILIPDSRLPYRNLSGRDVFRS